MNPGPSSVNERKQPGAKILAAPGDSSSRPNGSKRLSMARLFPSIFPVPAFLASALLASVHPATARAGVDPTLEAFCARPEAKDPKAGMLFETCKKITAMIEESATKNEFKCQCDWTLKMTPSERYEDGKKCEYRCDCSCLPGGEKRSFSSLIALSKAQEAGDSSGYICYGQELERGADEPMWKAKVVSKTIEVVPTPPGHRYPGLVKALDEKLSCPNPAKGKTGSKTGKTKPK